MINILIVENDIEYCKKIINETSKKYNNLRFCAIANSFMEMQKVISFQKIDIIIVNIDILTYITLEKIINIEIYKNSIILISENKLNFEKQLKSPYIYDYFFKNQNITVLINSITKLAKIKYTQNNEKILKIKIKHELKYLGYNLKHLGTKYLLETIYYLYTTNDSDDDNLEKNIYPIISKKYKKTSHNIKCNIINATNSMFYYCKKDILIEYLGVFDIYKTGPKTIACAVLNKITS